MISLEEFKKTLGDIKDKMSEKEILELRENQDKMAEIFVDMWLALAKARRDNV